MPPADPVITTVVMARRVGGRAGRTRRSPAQEGGWGETVPPASSHSFTHGASGR